MLKAENIAFRYNRTSPWILHNFSINVRQGEIVGLYGPSGRGKSTLAKMLAGYLHPNQGQILLDEAVLPSTGFCPVQLLFQHPELAVNPRWTIRRILNEATSPDKALLQQLSINPKWYDRYPHELSGGELQRICLARALTPNTRYLLCDEMTSMLDALTQATIWQNVVTLARTHQVGLLVVSHDKILLDRLCQRIVMC
ncbi:ABC transporter ATP-binding protein [Desulfovibrio inopinatus]|uniref:ABC transporter ATP-binding protein n=1 Tax=Desulfovibrio inopinatus TaxID=102109 RepID=UPI00040CA28E|nr:ATP-binding cassette domain-containing protein [Desulfovibrio inopinatus]